MDSRNPSGYAQVLEELTVSGGSTNLANAYTYGLALLSQRQPGVTTNFYGFDGHGSTRFLLNPAGGVTNTYTYDAYGNMAASSGTTTNSYLYCGEQSDANLGMYYLRARYMSPSSARFWTMDTSEGERTDPLSLHKYVYCKDNPTDGKDPSGHDFELGALLDFAFGFTSMAAQESPSVLATGSVANDLAVLNGTIARWRTKNWDFAADNLAHFVANTKTDLNIYSHHKQVKNDSGWRAAAWTHFAVKAQFGSSGAIGDKALSGLQEGADYPNPGSLTELFGYTFGNPGSALVEKNELFYALYGCHFTYYGTLSTSGAHGDSWSADVTIVLWDVLTFPSGLGRNMFSAYAAANDLETNHGWYGRSRVYAVWKDHFASNERP